ncbi:sigma-54 interaction domain protein [Leptospira ryugenii]|uniref:Sigma-54 interaction domain protein n=2 Tax=Leptospira ryugenii TaxID=1917863 RepID=A0A2P2E437_9LEPT|nr:sigma-54 interaction domain protein [Leptospira ryugenii]
MQSELAGNRNEVSLTIWLILLTTIELILTGIYFLGHTRLLDAVILAEIMNSGILVIFSGYVILYTSSTTGRTGFIPRLLGMSLVFFLIVSTLQSRYYEFLFRNSILQQVYDTTVETMAIPELEMEQIRLQAEVQHIGNYSHFFFEREGNFFIALRMLDGNEWKIFHYLKYRESIHSLILPSVWFQICLSILVLLFFPIFFKESFLLPIQQLMEEIKLEFQGIESRDSPKSFEFGVLRNALFRIADMIQKAKKDLPEVSETFDFLESYLSSKPKTLEIGNTSLVYKSSIFEKTIQKVEQAARFPHPVTITGETGSGKELAARMIHQLGENKNGPFVAVNCATLPENLWEAEIFGAKKGSFTDAKVDRKGRIQEADGGSLFFDEIGEMPLPIQAKMLRLLQEKTYTPLGANKEHIANCRFIFATNQNLSEMVEKKLFREDLLYRIQVFNIPLNPLRDRKEDIPYLWDFFTESFCNEYKMTKPKISQNAFRAILQYPWPGNIREMQNTVIQTLTQSPKELIEESDLPFLRTLRNDRDNHAFSLPRGLKLEEELEQLSKDRILQALELEKGNMTKAALRLGLKRTTLRYKMKDLGILD